MGNQEGTGGGRG